MPRNAGFVGLFTDYTALQMIFVPRTRKRYLGLFPWQGLFFKRRAELSRAFAKVAAEDMLSVGTLIESLLDGLTKQWRLEVIDEEPNGRISQKVDGRDGGLRVGARQRRDSPGRLTANPQPFAAGR